MRLHSIPRPRSQLCSACFPAALLFHLYGVANALIASLLCARGGVDFSMPEIRGATAVLPLRRTP